MEAIENRCRLCSVDLNQDEYSSIFDTAGLQDQIRKYLQITVKRDDYLPKIVCGICLKVLNDFDNLCTIARNTQKKFLILLNPADKTNETKPKTRRRRRKNYEIEEERDRKQLLNGFQFQMAQKFGHTADITNIKLGQIIRDTELLKLILKALKWEDNLDQLERLKNSDFRRILNNSFLLHDDDLIKLIRSYMGQDSNNNSNNSLTQNFEFFGCGNMFFTNFQQLPQNVITESVTEMEVKVDPTLFLPDEEENVSEHHNLILDPDDSRTLSIDLNEQMDYEEEKIFEEEFCPFQCTTCPERFPTHVQLQDHVLTHLINKTTKLQKTDSKSLKEKRGRPRKKAETSGLLSENSSFTLILDRKCEKDLKPFKCVFCPKTFNNSGNCAQHRKRMHPECQN